ncbi:hypothetical protein AX16_004448 [Volvariella volvacea WC 439]|nr:hypothetical protein AX16_004448 [Volvariella volvacea WC 439]
MKSPDRAYTGFFTSGFGAVTTKKRQVPVPANITTTTSPMVQSPCCSAMPSRAPSPSPTPTPGSFFYHSSDTDWDNMSPSPLASPTSTTFASGQCPYPPPPAPPVLTSPSTKSLKRSRRASLASLSSRLLARVRSTSTSGGKGDDDGASTKTRKKNADGNGFWTPSRSNSRSRYANGNASEVWVANRGSVDDDSLYNNYHAGFEQGPLDPFASAPDSKSIFIELTPTESYFASTPQLNYSSNSSSGPGTPSSAKLDYSAYPWSLEPLPTTTTTTTIPAGASSTPALSGSGSGPGSGIGLGPGHKAWASISSPSSPAFIPVSRTSTPTKMAATTTDGQGDRICGRGRERGRHQHQQSLLSFSFLSKKKSTSPAQATASQSTPSTPVQTRRSFQIPRSHSQQERPSTPLCGPPLSQMTRPYQGSNSSLSRLVPNRGPPLPPPPLSPPPVPPKPHGYKPGSLGGRSQSRQGEISVARAQHARTPSQVSTISNLSRSSSRSLSTRVRLGIEGGPRPRKSASSRNGHGKPLTWFIEEEDSPSRSSSPSSGSSSSSSLSPSPIPGAGVSVSASRSTSALATMSMSSTAFPKKETKSPLSIALSSPMSLSSPRLPLSPIMQNRREHLMEQGRMEQEMEDDEEVDQLGLLRSAGRGVMPPRGPRDPVSKKKRFGVVQFRGETAGYRSGSGSGSGCTSGSTSACTTTTASTSTSGCTDESSIDDEKLLRSRATFFFSVSFSVSAISISAAFLVLAPVYLAFMLLLVIWFVVALSFPEILFL